MSDPFGFDSDKLSVSPNYHFCNTFFPGVFFNNLPAFLDAVNKPEIIKNLLMFTFSLMNKRGYDYKPLFDIKATLKIDKEKDIIAFIFDIPNPTLETECNYVATVFIEGEPKYFESELYVDDNKFGLCGKNTLFDHVNYGFPLEDIKTVDDMWEAILKVVAK